MRGQRLFTKDKIIENSLTLQKQGYKIDIGKNFQREKKHLKLYWIARVSPRFFFRHLQEWERLPTIVSPHLLLSIGSTIFREMMYKEINFTTG